MNNQNTPIKIRQILFDNTNTHITQCKEKLKILEAVIIQNKKPRVCKAFYRLFIGYKYGMYQMLISSLDIFRHIKSIKLGTSHMTL